MITYEFLQQYWWFLVSLLAGLLVFLLFVQGANSMIFTVAQNEDERQLMVNSTGRKWELTFTTLVTFGGAFFASFPLFYSTSFGGAYWVWMLILITFVFQAVSYEFQNKVGNVLGKNAFRVFLVINGLLGPLLIGTAVGTFFTGSQFIVDKGAVSDTLMPVISRWCSDWRGLEAVANIFNVSFGLMVMFLSITLGLLYMINNIANQNLHIRLARYLRSMFASFLVLFIFVVYKLLTMYGFAVDADGYIFIEGYKYLHNFLDMPIVLALFLVGALLVVTGVVLSLVIPFYKRGIWFAGPGTVSVVVSIFLVAGYNNTAYYPSVTDLQSSLTIANNSSSEFTLKTMAVVSLIIPLVVAYIAYFWRKMDKKSLTTEELNNSEKY
ncbi:MAG: cytochrome d ubiquinol oxidase subunit II [Marinifilaceae bacterium]|nr:cytochrome d ubiquinol oxidase subunit II [Marinifilaceae bacterium]